MGIPIYEYIYPLPKVLLKMMFLFHLFPKVRYASSPEGHISRCEQAWTIFTWWSQQVSWLFDSYRVALDLFYEQMPHEKGRAIFSPKWSWQICSFERIWISGPVSNGQTSNYYLKHSMEGILFGTSVQVSQCKRSPIGQCQYNTGNCYILGVRSLGRQT